MTHWTQRDGLLYLMARSDGLIKIGWTSNRICWREYQTQREVSPLRLETVGCLPARYPEERAAHERFNHLLRDGREWFEDDGEIRRFFAPQMEAYAESQQRGMRSVGETVQSLRTA